MKIYSHSRSSKKKHGAKSLPGKRWYASVKRAHAHGQSEAVRFSNRPPGQVSYINRRLLFIKRRRPPPSSRRPVISEPSRCQPCQTSAPQGPLNLFAQLVCKMRKIPDSRFRQIFNNGQDFRYAHITYDETGHPGRCAKDTENHIAG